MNIPAEPRRVSPQEGGQKLLQFLQRCLYLPPALLHRLIRSGQVRVNGKRAKAFDRVQAGDMVRIPPHQAAQSLAAPQEAAATNLAAPLPPVVYEDAELLVCNKHAGLPVQPGSGHLDCLSARLQSHYANASFVPSPAHRIDKATSGLVLAAKSYAMLRLLHEAFAAADAKPGYGVRKEYLAWVQGVCPWSSPHRLEHCLGVHSGPDGERMQALPPDAQQGHYAALEARCLTRGGGYSLVHIRLITGRKHQIRAQLAAQGLPLVGDPKYGGPKHPQGLLLHAFRIALEVPGRSQNFEVLPPWKGPWRVERVAPWPEAATTG